MSTCNELTDLETGHRLMMKPAVRKIFCCTVTAAAGFIAAYALVAYAIALIYEIVWVVEAQGGLPVASALLMLCYVIVICATVLLVHGLIAKNNRYLLAWLITVVVVLIPECALVFYMSICHWGLQGVYGGAELACYVSRLPAVVLGVVFVQSAFAVREARRGRKSQSGAPAPGSEFDASHYVAEAPPAFLNDGFLHDNGKPLSKSGSMPDLRRHIPSRQSLSMPYPPPPPAYWQHIAERHLAAAAAANLRHRQHYGTWLGPRTQHEYKRRHSIVGAFEREYDFYPEDRTDCKSEMGYFRHPYDRMNDLRMNDPRMIDPRLNDPRMIDPRLNDPRLMYPPDYDPRFAYDYKSEEEDYGVNLLRHDPYRFSGNRYYYSNGLRNSHTSVGNESDDLGKYKDVAL